MPAGALRSPIVELHHARPLYQSGASLIGLLGWWTWPELHGRPKECALAFLRRTLIRPKAEGERFERSVRRSYNRLAGGRPAPMGPALPR